jgi:selenocysteine-specific elongation factor
MNDSARNFVLGTAGHIDHGKTALVRALTGVDTDRLPAEKERGITIDLGFASLQLGEYRLALVDVPGHERFIRNMLAGASGLDLALLVVAADDSVMPQTREHMEILRLLGLSGGLVALSKCDLAEPSWLDLVEEELRALLRGTFLEGSPIVRTSTMTGQGIDELKGALHELCKTARPGQDAGVFRMPIDRSFTVAGHGTVVTGTVVSGAVAVGEEIEWIPSGKTVRVRGLHRHDEPVQRVGRGARAAINLVGAHHSEIHRGQELAAPGYLEATRILSVEIVASDLAVRSLKHRGRYKLHLGTAEVSAVLSLLEANETRPGVPELAQLFVSEPVSAVYGQPFVLRDESPPATLGGGRVLQPAARRCRRRDVGAVARLGDLRTHDMAQRLQAVLAGQGLTSLTQRRLCACTGINAGAIEIVLAQLERTGALVELPVGPRRAIRVPMESALELEERVVRALGRLHAAAPRQAAIPRARLAAALPDLAALGAVASLIDRLKSQGRLAVEGQTVALPGYEPKLSQAERKLKADLAEMIRKGGPSPPDAAELAAFAGARAAVVSDLLGLLREEGQIVEISPLLHLDADAEFELRRRVGERLKDGSAITMAELRDLLGTTRKYAVPIGEYLDRIGLTRREGDMRRLGSGDDPGPSLAASSPDSA